MYTVRPRLLPAQLDARADSAGIPVGPGDTRDGNPSPLTDRDLHADHHSPLSAPSR